MILKGTTRSNWIFRRKWQYYHSGKSNAEDIFRINTTDMPRWHSFLHLDFCWTSVSKFKLSNHMSKSKTSISNLNHRRSKNIVHFNFKFIFSGYYIDLRYQSPEYWYSRYWYWWNPSRRRYCPPPERSSRPTASAASIPPILHRVSPANLITWIVIQWKPLRYYHICYYLAKHVQVYSCLYSMYEIRWHMSGPMRHQPLLIPGLTSSSASGCTIWPRHTSGSANGL